MDEFDRENALRWTWRGKLLHRIAKLLRIPASIGMYPIGKRREISDTSNKNAQYP